MMLRLKLYRSNIATVLLACLASGPWRGREWVIVLQDDSPSHTGGGRWSW